VVELAQVVLRPEPFDSPVAQALIAELQQEYVHRYGGVDTTPVDPAEFAPSNGYFVIAWLADTPVGCGGWRAHALPGKVHPVAEIKRMYVIAAARKRGVARLIIADLERTARSAGHPQIILETGDQQPEAVALYEATGFTPIAPFGLYRDEAGACHFGKKL
jgi:GNAT superfamily N-acetyltransferase